MKITKNKIKIKSYLFFKMMTCLNFFLKRKNKLFDNKIKKILIIKGDHIGDTIISTVCFKPLKENYPNAEIDVLCGSWGKKTYEYQNNIKNIYVLDHVLLNRENKNCIRRLLLFLQQLRKIIFILKKEKYDLCLLLRGQERGNMAFISYLINPKYIVGFKGICLENALDYKSEYNNFIPEKDNFLNLLEKIPKFKIKDRNIGYEVVLPKNIKIKPLIKDVGFNIILNIEGHDYNKKLPKEKVVEYLYYYRDKGVNIYVITPPNSKDIKKIQEEINILKIKNVIILDEIEDVFYLLSYLEKCDLLVSIDTSILHLATIKLKNIIGIYYDDPEITVRFSPNVANKYIIKGDKNSIRNIDTREIIKLTNEIIEKNKKL